MRRTRPDDAGDAFLAGVRRADAYARSLKPLSESERVAVVETFAESGITEVWLADASDRANLYFLLDEAEIERADAVLLRARLEREFPGSKVDVLRRPPGASATRIDILDRGRALDRALADLSIPWDQSADRDSDEWADLVDLEGEVAGWVSLVRDGGRAPLPTISGWRAEIARRPEWSSRWPDRIARVEYACSVLAQGR